MALAVWFAQWLFNGAWSWLFFGRRRMDLAFVDVCLRWLAALLFILLAWPAAPLAALLFVPDLAWISTAAGLNVALWRLNPSVP